MILLCILLSLLILFIIIDLVRGLVVKIHAIFSSDTSKISICFLYPLLCATVDMENDGLYLSFYLLKLRLFTSRIVRKKAFNMKRIIRSLKISDFDLSTSFGFRDPSVTGLMSGMLGILSSFVHIRSLNAMPDFLSDDQYVLVDASANIKVGHTIWGYLKYTS